MIRLLSVIFHLFLLSVPVLPVGVPAGAYAQQSDWKKAVELYRDVISGRRKMESLTAEERAMVLAVHRSLRRAAPSGASSECRDALERAQSAASEVASYSRRLSSCVEDGDHRDDCSSEFRRVRNAHSDYESAVSEVQSYCR